jgi:pimeloyl-ACP methyl ester carboxylesterase
MHLHSAGAPGAPTILFLHAAGTSGWMWEPVVERLSERFHCLVPDLPGHGRSADLPWQSLDATVDDLAALIARQGTGGRAHVVGLSLGAYVALRLLARRPDGLDRVVLSGVNVLPFPRPGLMRLMGYAMLPLMKRDLLLKAQARALRIPEDRLEGYRAAARAMSLRAFLRIGHELMAFRAEAGLQHVTAPTLVLAGEREQELIRRSIPEIVRALPAAEGYLVPGLGHGWSGEAPELFAQVVETWITGRSLPEGLMHVSG